MKDVVVLKAKQLLGNSADDWRTTQALMREARRRLSAEGKQLCVVLDSTMMEDGMKQPNVTRSLIEFADRAEVRDEKNDLISVLKQRGDTSDVNFIFDYVFDPPLGTAH